MERIVCLLRCVLNRSGRIYSRPLALAQLFDVLEKFQYETVGPALAGPGCAVEVEELSCRQQGRFFLVHQGITQVDAGHISVFSPLGAALVGLRVGDIAQVELFRRTYHFLILKIDRVQSLEAADGEENAS